MARFNDYTTLPIEEFELVNTTRLYATWTTLNIGAYSNFFAYECALVIGLIIGVYCNVPYVRHCRFFLMLLLEIVACALGISGFMAFSRDNIKPTHIAYTALVFVIFNLIVAILDFCARYQRKLHLFHLVIANATLWIGCIATTEWYRDGYQKTDGHYKDLWVFSYIAMWGGAMIAIPVPGALLYILYDEGAFRNLTKEELEEKSLRTKETELTTMKGDTVHIHVRDPKDADGEKKKKKKKEKTGKDTDKDADKEKTKKKKREDEDEDEDEAIVKKAKGKKKGTKKKKSSRKGTDSD